MATNKKRNNKGRVTIQRESVYMNIKKGTFHSKKEFEADKKGDITLVGYKTIKHYPIPWSTRIHNQVLADLKKAK